MKMFFPNTVFLNHNRIYFFKCEGYLRVLISRVQQTNLKVKVFWRWAPGPGIINISKSTGATQVLATRIEIHYPRKHTNTLNSQSSHFKLIVKEI